MREQVCRAGQFQAGCDAPDRYLLQNEVHQLFLTSSDLEGVDGALALRWLGALCPRDRKEDGVGSAREKRAGPCVPPHNRLVEQLGWVLLHDSSMLRLKLRSQLSHESNDSAL